MPDKRRTVGDLFAAFLEACEVQVAFGVISIHNMPLLDAIGRRNRTRFVPSRGEAGAVNMADAAARVSGRIGVAVTSTGTACGNAAGALVEAQTAGTPLLHVTGQIEVPYLDRNRGYIHEARDQLAMLKSVSKAAYRVWEPSAVQPTLAEAVRVAMTPPTGPVSVEIPVDVQGSDVEWPAGVGPHPVIPSPPSYEALDTLADRLANARRPLLWLGGGARGAAAPVRRLVDLGFGVVSSASGRGILPEDDPASLGSYTVHAPVQALYATCDAMLVAGSRLRGNETLKYTLALPSPLYQIDADPLAESRSYPARAFVLGDASQTLAGLADRLESRLDVDSAFASDLAAARRAAEADVVDGLGPYGALVDGLAQHLGRQFTWVRDVTISNSTWGNRLLRVFDPRQGVHAVGGGIGQGLPMGIGAALANGAHKTVCLVGDGGLQLSLGELATAAEEEANLLLLVMNSRSYEVIMNIQDARYDGRRLYADLLTPEFVRCCEAVGIPHWKLDRIEDLEQRLGAALAVSGPAMVEVDMEAIGPFKTAFAGPPVRTGP